MTILITGHKDSLNNGNMLLVLGLLAGLRQIASETSIILLSDLPEVDRLRYGPITDLNIIQRPWRKQGRSALFAITLAGGYFLWSVIGKVVEALSGYKGLYQKNITVQAFANSKIVVDVSGDDFTTAYGLVSPLQVLYELSLGKLFGARIVFLSQSIGPFKSLTMNYLARQLHRLVDVATFRDNASLESWLNVCGHKDSVIDKANLEAADLMHCVDIPLACEGSDDGPVIINLSNYIVEPNLKKSLGVPGNGKRKKCLTDYLTTWASFLMFIHATTNREIVLLPHTTRVGKGDDRYYLRRLKSLCQVGLPVQFVDKAITTYEVQRIVARSSFVIASRMHLALTALSCHVPFLTMAYSHKYDQLSLEKLEPAVAPVIRLSDYPFDRQMPELKHRFEVIWENRDIYREMIKKESERRKVLARNSMEALAKTLS